jgi:hypothetical protein
MRGNTNCLCAVRSNQKRTSVQPINISSKTETARGSEKFQNGSSSGSVSTWRKQTMVALSPDCVPEGVVRDKQLQVVNVAATLFKWNNGMAVNLKELAVVTGYDYATVRRWGVPLFDRKITKLEFSAWKHEQGKTEIKESEQPVAPRPDQPPGPATAARQRRLAADKFGGPPRRRNSRTSSL